MPDRNISSRDATYSDGRRGSSRAHYIPPLDRHSFRRTPRDDACYERRASHYERCNQTRYVYLRCPKRALVMRVRDQRCIVRAKPRCIGVKNLWSVSQSILPIENP